MVSSCSGSKAIDYCNFVRIRVHRATQNSLYSVFREECTRDFNLVVEAEAKAAPSVMDAGSGLLFFPLRNATATRVSDVLRADSRPEVNKDDSDCTLGSTPTEHVTIIGAGGFIGRFIAEQYLRRCISVSVLTSNAEYAKSIYIPNTKVEQEGKQKESEGFHLPSSLTYPRNANEVSYVDERGGGNRILRYEYEHKANPSRSVSFPRASRPNTSLRRRVALEIIEGDMTSQQDLELAMRQASVVYHLASVFPEPALNRRWWQLKEKLLVASLDRSSGLTRALDVCQRVDAHFVALTPLWVHSSRVSPLYWYRWLTSQHDYVRTVRWQERILSELCGVPAFLYSSGVGRGDDRCKGALLSSFFPIYLFPSMFQYLKRTPSPAELPEDTPEAHYSPMRFSLFRVSDIVYHSFNKHIVPIKNHFVNDTRHRHCISPGNLDARLLAGVLVKSVSLCKSIIGCRTDIVGRLRTGVDMKNTSSILRAFQEFRCE